MRASTLMVSVAAAVLASPELSSIERTEAIMEYGESISLWQTT